MGRRSSQAACQTCRDRHLKCDSANLPCANCTKSSRECKPGSWFLFKPMPQPTVRRAQPRDRHGSLSPVRRKTTHNQDDQKHDPSSFPRVGPVQFVDLTAEVVSRLESPNRSGGDTSKSPFSPSWPPGPHSETIQSPPEESYHIRQGSLSSHGPSEYAQFSTPPRSSHAALASSQGLADKETSSPSGSAQGGLAFAHQGQRRSDAYPQSSAPEWTAEDIFAARSHSNPFHSENSPATGLSPAQLAGQECANESRSRLSESEAHLFQYFVRVWGPLLDATDDTRQFSTSIPHLAWTESTCLLYAMLALAACQLSRISDHPIQTARFYRTKCAQVLVPILLEDPNKVHEASIFATYVLLRVYDHLTVNLSERQHEGLFSEGLALSTEPWNAYTSDGSLKRASFWIHLRQDIHTALVLECPVRVDHTLYKQTVAVAMEITEQDLAKRAATHSHGEQELQQPYPCSTSTRCNTKVECAWTNRLVGLTCRVLNYCFDTRPQLIQEWSSLLIELESWNVEKPDTFRPYFETGPDPDRDRPFPKIYLQNDWHVIGLLYYHMSVVLLKSNQPRHACKDKDLRTVEYNTREEILHHARVLCGIATSNPIHQCLLIVVAMMNVVACFFSDDVSQKGVLVLMDLAKSTTGTPSEIIADRLRQTWNRQ